VPGRTVADAGEHALIDRIRGRLSMPSWVVVGPGDDAAVIAPERGMLQVVTTDAQVEGVHFDRRFVPPAAIGHRAVAVNLSDLAAMGARPRAALLSLMLPDTLEVDCLDRLVDGGLALAEAHGMTLVGGNITRSPGPLVVDVTAIGSVRPRRILTRSGARPGDEVHVTGSVGEAAVGLRRLQTAAAGSPPAPGQVSELPSGCERRYLYPEPRVRMGALLGRNRVASSCMDASDGLADALRQLAQASGVGIEVDAAALPIGAAARTFFEEAGADPVRAALAGGDDYELVFTVRPRNRGRLRGVRQQAGHLPITRIGVVTADPRLCVRGEHGIDELPRGYEHFR
jgi:thiamine-monophosphate kinase